MKIHRFTDKWSKNGLTVCRLYERGIWSLIMQGPMATAGTRAILAYLTSIKSKFFEIEYPELEDGSGHDLFYFVNLHEKIIAWRAKNNAV